VSVEDYYTAHWGDAMSGIISVPLAVSAFFATEVWQKLGLAVTAVFCAGYASYRIWEKERKNVIKFSKMLETRNSQLTSFLQESTRLYDRCQKGEDLSILGPEIKKWSDDLDVFITENFGEDYTVAFHTYDGRKHLPDMPFLTYYHHNNALFINSRQEWINELLKLLITEQSTGALYVPR
jgi:hypothetical protein